MKIIFMDDCAADGCYNQNLGNGKQLCKKHQKIYDEGIPFCGFYGKTVLKYGIQLKHDNGNKKKN